MPLHEPVMTREVLAFLQPEKGGVFVDCTVGMGGHALAMLEAGATRVIGLDRDPAALAHRCGDAERVPRSRRAGALGLSGDRVGTGGPRHRSHRRHARGHGHVVVSARGRGTRLQLSARRPARHAHGHDDRTDRRRPAAWTREESEIADAIYKFGEERFSRRIARSIVEARDSAPLATTVQLATIVRTGGAQARVFANRSGDAHVSGASHLGESRARARRRVSRGDRTAA